MSKHCSPKLFHNHRNSCWILEHSPFSFSLFIALTAPIKKRDKHLFCQALEHIANVELVQGICWVPKHSAKIPEKTLNGHFCHFTDNSLLYSSHSCPVAIINTQASLMLHNFLHSSRGLREKKKKKKKEKSWITTPIEHHVATCLRKWGFGLKIEACAFTSANTYPLG